MSQRLSRRFYQRDPVTLARALLGRVLVRVVNGQRTAGRIVEVEAYLGEPDRAAHTFGGRRTARNRSMWGQAGHAYVYFTYGMHHCLNVVAAEPDEPVAALIRALEPMEGIEAMWARRPKARREVDLCSGPAKLCQALAVDRSLDGADLVTGEQLFIERARRRRVPNSQVARSPRIGVAYAGEWALKPLRFHLRENPHVSKP